MKPYRVLITGSREFVDAQVIAAALRQARGRAEGRPMVIVHGAARGADSLAASLADRAQNAVPEPWPALWRRATVPFEPDGTTHSNPRLPEYNRTEALHMQHRRGRGDYDRRAGFARNEAMLESGIDEVLAFFRIGAKNAGTTGAVQAAERLGITVHRFEA